MITLIKMKYKEWKFKLALYAAIETIIAEQKDIITLISDLYTSLKDVPFNQLKDEFLRKLAEVINEQDEADRDIDSM